MGYHLAHFPLLCGFRDLVLGNGFLAEVAADGRALAVREGDCWWLYGVNPGAIAEGGATLMEAHARLRQTFKAYLIDVAQEASDFDTFRTEIERFFSATNLPTEKEWTEAVAEVRAGKATLPELQKASADSPRSIRVELKEVLAPSENKLEEEPAVAA